MSLVLKMSTDSAKLGNFIIFEMELNNLASWNYSNQEREL